MMVAYLYRHLVTGISAINSDIHKKTCWHVEIRKKKNMTFVRRVFLVVVLQNWLPVEAYSICWCARNCFLAFGEFLDLQSTESKTHRVFFIEV